MKLDSDATMIRNLAPAQRGVFSKADLRIALAEKHPAGFVRRIRALVTSRALQRCSRGWYVTEGFDLPTLSQRLAATSYISFETVLARALVIGPNPNRQILAVKVGRTRSYVCGDARIEHVGISAHLFFGFELTDGVRFADPEKATLDVLYFHLRGRPYTFDIYSDLNVAKLDKTKLSDYLEQYKNKKFVTFAKGILGIE